MAKYGPFEWERRLGQRNHSFEGQVDAIVVDTIAKMQVLMQASVQEVIEIAQTPGISARAVSDDIAAGIGADGKRRSKKRYGPITAPQNKGGKMRVDTGFLRASGQISFNGMPTGPIRGEADKKYKYEATLTTTEIAKWAIGKTLFFGWTAEYAKYREAYDGFLESAIMRWQEIVNRNTEKLRGITGD